MLNAGNQQNWHFYLILSKITLISIADAVQANAELIVKWPESKTIKDVADRMLEKTLYFVALRLPLRSRSKNISRR